MTVFTFDFSGSGNSEGDYVSLGLEEEKDLVVVLRHLRKTGRVSSIALWGHSLGASTAVLRAGKDHAIAACVLDSPFTDLRTVAEELIHQSVSLPHFMVDFFVDAMRTEVLTRAGFDLQEVIPKRCAPKATCPALFGAASDDVVVLPHHAQDLHDAWGGTSHLFTFGGGHNGERPAWFVQEAVAFLVRHLHPWTGGFEDVPLNADIGKSPSHRNVQATLAHFSVMITSAGEFANQKESGENAACVDSNFLLRSPPRNSAMTNSATDLAKLLEAEPRESCVRNDSKHSLRLPPRNRAMSNSATDLANLLGQKECESAAHIDGEVSQRSLPRSNAMTNSSRDVANLFDETEQRLPLCVAGENSARLPRRVCAMTTSADDLANLFDHEDVKLFSRPRRLQMKKAHVERSNSAL
jgi:alpha/beta superfamily hydrolase